MKLLVCLLAAAAAASAESYYADTQRVIGAELALLKVLYKEELAMPVWLGELKTEDFLLSNMTLSSLSDVRAAEQCSLLVNTDNVDLMAQNMLHLRHPVLTASHFSAPFLFYEGDQVLSDVSFTIDSLAINIRSSVLFHKGNKCSVFPGMEVMSLEGVTMHSQEPALDGRDVSMFFQYTVRSAINQQLEQLAHTLNMEQLPHCPPFKTSPASQLFSVLFAQ